MTDATQAVLINAVSPALLGFAYGSLAAGLAIGLAVAILPALLLRRRGGRFGGARGGPAAEPRSTTRLELEAVARLSTELSRAHTAVEVARPVVREVTHLLNLGFAAVVVVDEAQSRASGVYGELGGEPARWWSDLDLDLRKEPSGIASAVFDAAPVVVFDVSSSPLVNPRLSDQVGAKSGVWIPMIAEERVTGVVVAASTDTKRAFSPDEMALLSAVAAEGAMALARLRSGEALSNALAENERHIEHASTEHARQERIQLGFSKVASLLGEPVSLEESYAAAAAAAADVLDADAAALLVPAADTMTVAGSHRLPPAVRGLGVPRVIVETSTSRHMLAAPRLHDDDRFEETWRAAGIGSLLAIPVPGDAGVLLLSLFDEPRQFGRDDLALAGQLALAARGVLDRSRLFEAERASRSLSQRLGRAGARLLRELDPDAVLKTAVTEAAALLEADGATLTQVAPAGLVIAAAAGDDAATLAGTTGPVVGWPAGDVVHSGDPMALHDVPQTLGDPMLDLGYRAYVGVPIRSADGEVGGVLSVYGRRPRAWDDEEREALQALAGNTAVALANAELYRRVALEREQSLAILSNIADGIVAVDRDDRVVMWNRAAEVITGVPASESIGRSPAQVLQRDLDSENGLVAIRRGDDEVWLQLSEAVMRDPSGAVVGRIFAFRDISSEHAMETMRSEFVSAVSVDLRAPLTSIYGFAQTLLRDDVAFSDEDRRRFLEFIAREAEHLTATVDSLLEVGRTEEPLSLPEELVTAPRTEEIG